MRLRVRVRVQKKLSFGFTKAVRFGNLEIVIGTLVVYPRLFEFYHLVIQNTVQLSQWSGERGVCVWWCGVRPWMSVYICVMSVNVYFF